MSLLVLPTAPAAPSGIVARPLRIAFLGPPGWLDRCCPPGRTESQSSWRMPIQTGTDVERVLNDAVRFDPTVTIVFDPGCLAASALRRLPGTTLGIVVGGVGGFGDAKLAAAAGALDRVLSFRPALTGTALGPARVWRAIPPPIGDVLFGQVRPLHGPPLAMAIGRSTEYREHLLMPAKHAHDLLQVVHGVGGGTLIKLLREYDVGVYVPPDAGDGFGAQVGMHLAAGQLLIAAGLDPAHGLERGIDYVHVDTPADLAWTLERLARFPEMYQRQRIRGRMKAEAYRASRLFARVVHDLLSDVAVFGSDRD